MERVFAFLISLCVQQTIDSLQLVVSCNSSLKSTVEIRNKQSNVDGKHHVLEPVTLDNWDKALEMTTSFSVAMYVDSVMVLKDP